MPLPHFSQLPVATSLQEPVYLNLFEITFILPTLLQAQGRDPFVMLQQASKVPFMLTEDIGVATQKFKYSTRAFLQTPESTHKEFAIPFNVNVDDNGSMVVWNTLKAWYDLVWNSQNGSLNYKSDLVGTVIVNQHDKKGVVIRRVTYQNVQIKGVAGYDLAWGGGEIITDVTANFVADYWIDEYIDQDYVVNPPVTTGYATSQ